MDLTTLMTVAGLFLSIVVGNAAIFGESLFASISVPKAVETSGLDRATAERLFAAQVAWYARLPSILPTPSVSTSSAPSVAMALAKPIQLGDLVYSVQTQLRTDVVSANGAIMEAAGLENLAATTGIRDYGSLSLEKLITMKPEVLIWVAMASIRSAASSAESIGRGPYPGRPCAPKSQNRPVISLSPSRATGTSRCSSGACCEQAA